ncbi:uncharacterized protein LOC119076824 [Bradysia coprophila]|uniref:uncharacterized protein LOC119076824 n=1 Tax=Bradysia coprophila TaxID=38358 RepID=UPI00187D7343|nr:uncharacterized protein LOC119076824 [Bradysia coprophila]
MEQINLNETSTMAMTDMNFDCLERCLQHLNIEERLNVADCNKQLRGIVRYIIAREFPGNLWISAVPVGSYESRIISWSENEEWLHITGLKFGLKFLRCCGDLVSTIAVSSKDVTNYSKNYHANFLIIGYINEYCSEFLTEQIFRSCSEDCLKGLTKPFKKVETLEMSTSFINDTRLSKLFPNLRNLELSSCGSSVVNLGYPKEFFANCFPSLEHLSLEARYWKTDYENVADILRSHPQLKSLKGNIWLDVIFGTKYLSHGSDHLQNLEKLHLTEIIFEKSVNERIHLKNLKALVLDIEHAHYNRPWTIPFKCDNLESLEIEFLEIGFENELIELIASYSSVKKFKLSSRSSLEHVKISKALPLLEEIDFSHYSPGFTIDEVVRFVGELGSLKLFEFLSPFATNIEELMERLESGWLVLYGPCGCRFSNRVAFSIKLER